MTIFTNEKYVGSALVERDVIDTVAATFTVFDGAGQQQSQRALTAAEAARYAALDTANTADTNRATIQQRANAALTTNATYLAITTPTNAQVAAQVAVLTKECNGLIRLLLNVLDTTTGT